MAFTTRELQEALVTHAKTLGVFVEVVAHEPVGPPGQGVTACVVWAGAAPAVGWSGLGATAARVNWMLRLLTPSRQQPFDRLDTLIMDAADAYMRSLVGDFTLGVTGVDVTVDVRGMAGPGVSIDPGWTTVGDVPCRSAMVTFGLIVDNLWTEAP